MTPIRAETDSPATQSVMPPKGLPQAEAGAGKPVMPTEVGIHAFPSMRQRPGWWATEHAREGFAHHDGEKPAQLGQTPSGLA